MPRTPNTAKQPIVIFAILLRKEIILGINRFAKYAHTITINHNKNKDAIISKSTVFIVNLSLAK